VERGKKEERGSREKEKISEFEERVRLDEGLRSDGSDGRCGGSRGRGSVRRWMIS
jgi:hypothetical protein